MLFIEMGKTESHESKLHFEYVKFDHYRSYLNVKYAIGYMELGTQKGILEI